MRGLLLILALLFATPAWAVITFDAATESENLQPDGTFSFTHTIGSCSNSILVIGMAWHSGSGQTLNSVTVDGNNATQIDTIDNTGGARAVALWYYVGAAAGSRTIAGALSASSAAGVISVSSYCGVHQTVTIGTAVKDQSDFGDPSVTVTSAVGEMVVDVAGGRNNGSTTFTVGAGQTEDTNLADAAIVLVSATSHQAGAASVDMTWTLGDPSGWAQVGVSLKPAAVTAKPKRRPVTFQ